jgi:hypothetical protein
MDFTLMDLLNTPIWKLVLFSIGAVVALFLIVVGASID